MSFEYLDIVDKTNGEPTGIQKSRTEVHALGLWHRTVHVYVFRRIGAELEFLVHLRSKNKDLKPLKWDTRFGGHLKTGETWLETAITELRDEIGIDESSDNLIEGPIKKRTDEKNNEFTKIYFYRFNGDTDSFTFNDGEVEQVKWLSEQRIEDALINDAENWCSSLKSFKLVVAWFKEGLE